MAGRGYTGQCPVGMTEEEKKEKKLMKEQKKDPVWWLATRIFKNLIVSVDLHSND